MLIRSSFEVPVSPDRAWGLLTDLPRLAPCMPGARIDAAGDAPGTTAGAGLDRSGPSYQGSFTVKVGPVRAVYRGVLRVLEQDTEAGVIVLDGAGTDQGGAGSVAARIRAEVTSAGSGCVVRLETDIDITGRLAQFTGRSSMVQGIADRIIEEFAANLRALLDAPADSPATAVRVGDLPTQDTPHAAAAEFDALRFGRDLVGRAVEPRLLALVAGAALLGWLAGRRSGKASDRLVVLLLTPDGTLERLRPGGGGTS